MTTVRRWVVLVSLLFAGVGPCAYGQEVDVGGRAYMDYFYTFASPDTGVEGVHGFRYRRLYLTTDFILSESFSGRARLEANDGTTGPNGPEPYVKDLSLTWAYTEDHSATLGVTPPPAFSLGEEVWGYRSLEKMILDRVGIVRSRDFGLRLDGLVTESPVVRYAVMVANNSGVRPETDAPKRVYGQLELRPSDPWLFVVGADHAGYDDARDAGTRVSAFGGYVSDPVRVGFEGYAYRETRTLEEDGTAVGGSLFGIARIAAQWSMIARLDRSRRIHPDRFETLVLGGIAYRPHPSVELTPNLRVLNEDDGAAETTGRFTVEINF